jgi:hypothetical protein
LLVTDYDARRAVLSVTKARVLRRDKDRTKTQEDRDVELCPRALEVLRRHLALRAKYVAAGKVRHEHLFFLEDEGRSAIRKSLAGAGARASRRSTFEGAGPTMHGIPQ